ncbi:hypothetical protein TNCV_3931841 [Trichonephila clavipes]|nr:hypothetical protein TNCV_3931841 [Trichonephila clavipes]
MFWNFGKADWSAFAELTEKDFSSLPLSHQLNVNWVNFKAVVIRNAKKTIPRGNFKSFKATYMYNDPYLRALVDKRGRLFQNLKYTNSQGPIYAWAKWAAAQGPRFLGGLVLR